MTAAAQTLFLFSARFAPAPTPFYLLGSSFLWATMTERLARAGLKPQRLVSHPPSQRAFSPAGLPAPLWLLGVLAVSGVPWPASAPPQALSASPLGVLRVSVTSHTAIF